MRVEIQISKEASEVVQGRGGDDLDLGGSGGRNEGWSCSGYSRSMNNILFSISLQR